MGTEVIFASAADGVRLPVIDVTHPVFAVSATEEELAGMAARYLAESAQMGEMAASVREALQRSVLGSAVMAAAGSYLAGMATYQLKLGPEKPGGWANAIDGRIAGSFPAFCARLRLQDMAELLAEGMAGIAGEDRLRPICMVNIAGGAGADSWNGLVLLRAMKAGLEGRKVAIAIVDPDNDGPLFGKRAVRELCGEEAALGGLEIEVRHYAESWSDRGRLAEILRELRAAKAVCAVSSEGGLFEYGTDEEILGSLSAVHEGTAEDAFVVGSVTREGECARVLMSAAIRPRSLDDFRELVGKAGWIVQRVMERPFSYNLRLGKMGSRG